VSRDKHEAERRMRWLHVVATSPNERGQQHTRCDTKIRDREPNTGALCPRCAAWLRIMNTHAERRLRAG